MRRQRESSAGEIVLRRQRSISSTKMFFFSSRRRHTRCLSDWSSDVCSSDLHSQHADRGPRAGASVARADVRGAAGERSGEGRVGEKCGFRWVPYNLKKKKRSVLVLGLDSAVAALTSEKGGVPVPIAPCM